MAAGTRPCGIDARPLGRDHDIAGPLDLHSAMSRRAAFLLAAFALVGFAGAPQAQTSEYANVAMISATMGVSGSRVCIGEGSRGDIGCPTYAPFLNSAGDLGLGTATPVPYGLHIRRGSSSAGISVDAPSSEQTSIDLFTIGNGQNALGQAGTRGWHILARGKTNSIEDRGNLVFYHWDGTGWYSPFSINDETGNIGIGVISATAKLTVFDGEIQTASSGAACTGPLAGAIRYTGGNLSYCNGSAWTLIGGASGGTPGGVSGSIQFNSGGAFAGRSDVIVDETGSIQVGSRVLLARDGANNGWIGATGSGSETERLAIGFLSSPTTGAIQDIFFQAGGAERMRINSAGNIGIGTGNPTFPLTVYGGGAIALVGIGRSSTEVDFAYPYESVGTITSVTNLRLQSANSIIFHTGMTSNEPDDNSKARVRIDENGSMGIGTIWPTAPLEVAGRVSATIMQIGESNDGCTTATVGSIRRNPATGRFQICRM